MSAISQTCRLTGKLFEISEADQEFYMKMGVPIPTMCPEERMRRRFAFRNERKLYRRKCSATGQDILSIYHPDVPFPVYETSYWWGDSWDQYANGRDFDFNRSFFEQFAELQKVSPVAARAVHLASMQNSDYCNACNGMKDCYMVFEASQDERCLYSRGIYFGFDCVDCLGMDHCEGCYECVDCQHSTFSKYLFHSKTCSDCHFSANLIGCSNCFGCVNLRNKTYHFFNQPYSKEEYEKKVQELKSLKSTEDIFKTFEAFRLRFPVKYAHQMNTQNSTGDYLSNVKDCQECYDVEEAENCNYCTDISGGNGGSHHSLDIHLAFMGIEYCYECHAVGMNSQNVMFCDATWGGASNVMYSRYCVNGCQDCFGCISLKKARYCILNKQYTKEEYESLVPRIIEQMKGAFIVDRLSNMMGNSHESENMLINDKRSTINEFGEFFPAHMSTFAYNESFAQDYFPLTKEQALQLGYTWRDQEVNIQSVSPAEMIPNVPVCDHCSKQFRVIPQEKVFYEKWNVVVPKVCFECRHKRRMSYKNPRRMYVRNCMKCTKEIQSTYSPEGKEMVYCEQCYLEEVY